MKKIKDSAPDEGVSPMVITKLPAYFLIVCLLVALGFLLNVLRPFITVLFVSGVLTIAFYPIYKRVLVAFKGWARSAAFATCLLVVLLIIAPITLFTLMLAGEGVSTYQVVQEKVTSGVFDKYLTWKDGGFFYDLKQELEPVVDLEQLDLKKNILEMAQNTSTFLVSQTAVLLKSISNLLLSFLVMLFAMFYFFKDGDKIVQKIGSLSPLPSLYEKELFQKIASMVKAIVFGVFLTAVVQGLVGGIGFAVVGISGAVFWGTTMAFLSMIPVFGTASVWVPASIILAILGDYTGALILFLWGVFLIGSVDNILRPYLIGGKAHTYPLLTFFVILGGVWSMGFKGVIIGPLVLVVVMSFLHIYEAEYSKVLKK